MLTKVNKSNFFIGFVFCLGIIFFAVLGCDKINRPLESFNDPLCSGSLWGDNEDYCFDALADHYKKNKGRQRDIEIKILGQEECYGHTKQVCFLTSDGFFYDFIKGFLYEEGYEYVLIVTEKQIYDLDDLRNLADASAFEYTLKKVVSKTQKNND